MAHISVFLSGTDICTKKYDKKIMQAGSDYFLNFALRFFLLILFLRCFHLIFPFFFHFLGFLPKISPLTLLSE